MKQITLSTVTIGSDPEYGIIDINGIPKSVVGYLPGTKKEPFELGDGISCQRDNVGAECCIPPAKNKYEFVRYMMLAKMKTQKKLRQSAPDFRLVSVSSQRYDDVELDSDEARMFGCEPSYCVYTQSVSPRPTPEQVGNLRSFGFHIHIGFPIEDGENQIEYVDKIIKAMDYCVGVPSIIIDRDSDRRQIYGNAGDLRFRRINDILVVEYRTLGGFMHSSPVLIEFVYNQTIKAVGMLNQWNDALNFENCRDIIDNGNIEMAIEFCNINNIEIPEQYKHFEKLVTV